MLFKRLLKPVCGLVLLSIALVCVGSSGAAEVFPAFSSRNANGEPVTDAIFAGAKLTMVNVWATWCPPCRGEMPDLALLGRSMPEGSQLVGIILDGEDSGAMADAEEIFAKANADFLQILPVKEMDGLLKEIRAIPTTFFVDSQGKIVGKPLVGARSEKAYRVEIEKILKSMPF